MANVVSITINGFDKSTRAFAQAKANVIGLQKVAAALATSWVAMAAAATKSAIDSADALGKMAEKASIPVEALSRLSHAASLSNVESGTLQTGLIQLSKTLSETLSNPASEAARILRAMGVAATDTAGKLKPTEETLLALADKFRGFEDNAAKSALALKLFGKSGAELLPLLNQGAEGIRQL